MKLPNGEHARIDDAKLIDYCLSLTHPVGKHKARLFAAVFGITAEHAPSLRLALLEAARAADAAEGPQDEFGTRYRIVAEFKGPGGHGLIVSAWLVPNMGLLRVPTLLTCYPLINDSE
jgi:hypothetical protein